MDVEIYVPSSHIQLSLTNPPTSFLTLKARLSLATVIRGLICQ
jgi:hypothetical protein